MLVCVYVSMCACVCMRACARVCVLHRLPHLGMPLVLCVWGWVGVCSMCVYVYGWVSVCVCVCVSFFLRSNHYLNEHRNKLKWDHFFD